MDSSSVLQCCFSASWGGLEMVALESAHSLTRSGFLTVTVCPPESPLQHHLIKSQLKALPLRRRHKYLALSAVRGLRTELETLRPKAILVQQLNDLWQVVPALRGFPDVRLVGMAHTFVGIDKKDSFHRWLYGRLDRLVALTELHKQNLIERLPIAPERVVVLPNSIDLKRFNPQRRSQEWRQRWSADKSLLVGVVSRLDPQKGLLAALAAADLWRQWNLDIQLVIIGKETANEPGMQARLEQEIQALNLQGRVHLAGHCDHIEQAIASLDVLLMPSPAETFGRVLIEAMASGVPVVATSGGGVPDIIQQEKNGLLVQPRDFRGMAESVRRYLADPTLRQKVSAQALSDCQNRYAAEAVQRRLRCYLGLESEDLA